MAKKKTQNKKTAKRDQRSPEGRKRAIDALKKHAPKKGEVRNPKGHNGYPITSHMRRLMDQDPATTPYIARIIRNELNLDPHAFETVGEVISYVSAGEALRSSVRHLETLLDRIEGKCTQKIEQTLDANLNDGSISIDDLNLDVATRKKLLAAIPQPTAEDDDDC